MIPGQCRPASSSPLSHQRRPPPESSPECAPAEQFRMNDVTFSRIAAHNGSSFGSNTTHCVPGTGSLPDRVRSLRTGSYPLIGIRVGAHQRARSPQHVAIHGEDRNNSAPADSARRSPRRSASDQSLHTRKRRFQFRVEFSAYAARRVDARIQSCQPRLTARTSATGTVQRIGQPQPRKEY